MVARKKRSRWSPRVREVCMPEYGGLLHSLKQREPCREKYLVYSAECDLCMCNLMCSSIIYHYIALSQQQAHILTYLGYNIK